MQKFTVIAYSRESQRVSRHGIARRAGGEVLDVRHGTYPAENYSDLVHWVQQDLPGARVVVKLGWIQP